MRPVPRALAFSLIPLTALLLAAPGFAQGLPAESDPFSGLSAVDTAHMSAVGGVPGTAGLPAGAGQRSGSECGAGCGTAAPAAADAPTTQQVTYGNSVTVNVTAINTQTSIAGPGVVNTGGGLNSAGGGN